jgi:YYY domain-containing protein
VQQVLSVASWFFIITFLQISLYPSLKKTFERYAYPAAFAASLLFFTLISWYCGLFLLPIQIAVVPFFILFLWHVSKRRYSVGDLKAQWQWELVFLIFFFLMLEVRFVNPTISYAEKFMDHALLASVMRSPVVPPLDPWFAGGFMNVYYYLGYWMFGCLGIVSGVPSYIAFNLALPTVLGIAALNLFAIGNLLLDRYRWLPLLTLLIPNPALVYQLIMGTTVNPSYDPSLTWLGTRTITNTINEFPLFSFIWGDLHPHVIDLFNQLFLIFILIFAFKQWDILSSLEKWVLFLMAAVSLGSMPLINSWDVLIYAPITVLFGILIWWKNRSKENLSQTVLFLITIPLLAIICYLPFYFQQNMTTGGVGLVDSPSNPVQFLFVHGFFIAILFAFLKDAIVQKPYYLLLAIPLFFLGYAATAIAIVPIIYILTRKEHSIPDILAILGLVLITICEFFYLKDNMGEINYRMNTVFKLYFAAWLLLGISILTMCGQALSRLDCIPIISRRTQTTSIIIIAAILFIIPLSIPFNMNYRSRTLDGFDYLKTTHPGDAAAIEYLMVLPSNYRLIEAVGGDFTYYSRISSFTGIPAVMGQPFHEYLWRGEKGGWFGERINDVKQVYENPEKTIPLMKKYNATFLIVGELERNSYNITIPTQSLELVFSKNGTTIYKIPWQ